jgi:hypothetical protein
MGPSVAVEHLLNNCEPAEGQPYIIDGALTAGRTFGWGKRPEAER